MNSLYATANRLAAFFDEKPLPRIEPVTQVVHGFSAAFLRQLEADQRRYEMEDAARCALASGGGE